MPPKKSPLTSAACHLADARKRMSALADDTAVSAKHARSMKAAIKVLDKGIAKLQAALAAAPRAQSGGFAPLELSPGVLDRGAIISNSSGLTVSGHNPLGQETMDRINSPKNMPQPFSTNDDPSLHLPTSGLDPTLKNSIAPNLGGYMHNYGTTQVATMAGGAKRRSRAHKRT